MLLRFKVIFNTLKFLYYICFVYYWNSRFINIRSINMAMEPIRFILFVFIFSVLLSGCFLNSSITPLDSVYSPAENNHLSIVPKVETTTGSYTYQRTQPSGYRVKQSVGAHINKQFASTPNGYHVYLHVSGQITSEELTR